MRIGEVICVSLIFISVAFVMTSDIGTAIQIWLLFMCLVYVKDFVAWLLVDRSESYYVPKSNLKKKVRVKKRAGESWRL